MSAFVAVCVAAPTLAVGYWLAGWAGLLVALLLPVCLFRLPLNKNTAPTDAASSSDPEAAAGPAKGIAA